MLTAALPGLCTTTIQMGRSVIAVSAWKILEMLSSVMKSCRNPTFSWITACHKQQFFWGTRIGCCIIWPNRGGWLCKDCIDGFGPSVVSIGYACANCTENNYGWMLYILSEFFPATLFYFVVLTLRVRITSAPMNCFVMFSQLLVNLANNASVFLSEFTHTHTQFYPDRAVQWDVLDVLVKKQDVGIADQQKA